ncbi:sulfite reductase flavoprotein subunit alpha [Mycobacterium sp. 236(2023)]|uniref:diflavin oxidoreductase n=1 Tax=Mycobacterium sp. 236(2023) TaxID=3038163 RepID=UPI002414F560|nr:sulfite reductase flavoprotein subunit alpha [Mycobacterium sp. 236(2023)]MDG4663156.1 sulfite reductase flavoprotein subunit alpha [Mycobacterium sp. 236(2023)]
MSDDSSFSLVLGFATETGNSTMVAKKFAQAARGVGIDVEPQYLNDLNMASLASATHFVVITATYGDGELPYDAEVFWEELSGDGAGRLDHLTFAVCGLGDSFYPYFNNAAKLVDARLEELGATRMLDRVDCDLEFEEPSEAFTADVVEILGELTSSAPQADAPEVEAAETDSPWTRRNPFSATLVANRPLTATGSDKSVRHYEIDLADSGITYTAGDSLGVHPVNDPALVAAVLSRLGVDADYVVAERDQPLGVLLTEHLELRIPTGALQSLVASRTEDAEAAAILGGADSAALTNWLFGRDVLDLLELADLSVDDVIPTLRPLQHRDYSIASSPVVHPGQIHLTVATVEYDARGRAHRGVASGFLADRAETLRIHMAPNDSFRLPAPDVPIIMIGPGTGIAPFRAFLQERQATGASGKSWLFFGDRHRATDFLYGDELTAFRESGVLTRLDCAFSRDQEAKDYVQHHMLANAAELFAWLEDGAHVYVCGDADHMAKDVHRALHEVISTAGGLDEAGAHSYVNNLITTHRYLRDVY